MLTRVKNRLIATQKKPADKIAALIEILSSYRPPVDSIQITNKQDYEERLASFGRKIHEEIDEDSNSEFKAESQALCDYRDDRFSTSEIDFIKANIKSGDQLALILFGVGSGRGCYNLIDDLDSEFLQTVIQDGDQLSSILSTIQNYYHDFLLEKLTINSLRSIIKDSNQLCNILEKISLPDRPQLIKDLGLDYLKIKILNQDQLDSVSSYIHHDNGYPVVLNQLASYCKEKKSADRFNTSYELFLTMTKATVDQTPLEKYTKEMQTYVESFKEKSLNTSLCASLPREAVTDDLIDIANEKIPNIPVRLKDRLYDLSTLLFARSNATGELRVDPLLREETFKLTDIKPAQDVQETIEFIAKAYKA